MNLLHIISHIAARHLSKRGRAIRELERMVEANKRAPATIEFARRRAAMLKHTRQMGA